MESSALFAVRCGRMAAHRYNRCSSALESLAPSISRNMQTRPLYIQMGLVYRFLSRAGIMSVYRVVCYGFFFALLFGSESFVSVAVLDIDRCGFMDETACNVECVENCRTKEWQRRYGCCTESNDNRKRICAQNFPLRSRGMIVFHLKFTTWDYSIRV